MECFRHQNAQGVAICRVCSKAVCRDCARDGGMFISCSEACSKEAADLHEMNQRGKKIYGIGVPRKTPSGVIMWLLFALLFGVSGIYESYRNQEISWFPILFALISLFIAFTSYKRMKDIGLQC
jgi:hypothetical protein